MSRGIFALFSLLLLGFGLLSAEAILSNSVVIDEYAHVPAGVAYWRDGLFSMYDENPPLVKLLTSLPVHLSGAVMDYSKVGSSRRWEFPVSHDFRRANAARYFELFHAARFVVTIMAVVCGLLLYHWAARDGGPAVGLACASLWFTDPNVIAHSTIATTDIGTTLAGFAATYLFLRYLRAPRDLRAIGAGIGLGMALGSKFSMILLLPAWAVIAALVRPPRIADWMTTLGASARSGVLIGLVALSTLSGLYGFRGIPTKLGDVPLMSPLLCGVGDQSTIGEIHGNRFRGTWLGAISLPVPRDYLVGFDSQLFEQQSGGFANVSGGRIVNGGFWYSPLKTLLLKTPPGTLLLLIAAIVSISLAARRVATVDFVPWVIPALLLGTLCAQGGGLNFAYRYLLPALPFVLLGMGKFFRDALASPRGRVFSVACLVGNVVSLANIWPDYLCYGNDLVGGSGAVRREFLGSNFDWGQDLLRLKRWADGHPRLRPLAVSYYGPMRPSEVGIDTFPLPAEFLEFGDRSSTRVPVDFYWAVSSNMLNGLNGLIDVDGSPNIREGVITSTVLDPRRAVDRVGRSIYIFRVEAGWSNADGPNRPRACDLSGCISAPKPFENTATP